MFAFSLCVLSWKRWRKRRRHKNELMALNARRTNKQTKQINAHPRAHTYAFKSFVLEDERGGMVHDDCWAFYANREWER